MKISKQLFYSFLISIAFILLHIIIENLKLSEILNLILSLSMMLLIQLFAYATLKKHAAARPLEFVNIFSMLCFTQIFTIIFLSLNSAFNPFVETKPINISEILISLFIFAGILPLIISTIIWLTIKKGKK